MMGDTSPALFNALERQKGEIEGTLCSQKVVFANHKALIGCQRRWLFVKEEMFKAPRHVFVT